MGFQAQYIRALARWRKPRTTSRHTTGPRWRRSWLRNERRVRRRPLSDQRTARNPVGRLGGNKRRVVILDFVLRKAKQAVERAQACIQQSLLFLQAPKCRRMLAATSSRQVLPLKKKRQEHGRINGLLYLSMRFSLVTARSPTSYRNQNSLRNESHQTLPEHEPPSKDTAH